MNYTTNAVESLDFQLRKIIKNRGHFPNDQAAVKLLWLAICNVEDKRAARGPVVQQRAHARFARRHQPDRGRADRLSSISAAGNGGLTPVNSSPDRPERVTIYAGMEKMQTDDTLRLLNPRPGREGWCSARLTYCHTRLSAILFGAHTILVNRSPLVRQPTLRLCCLMFALWYRIERAEEWPVRFGEQAVAYGNQRIALTGQIDIIPHHESFLAYPLERGWPGGALLRHMVCILQRAQR